MRVTIAAIRRENAEMVCDAICPTKSGSSASNRASTKSTSSAKSRTKVPLGPAGWDGAR